MVLRNALSGSWSPSVARGFLRSAKITTYISKMGC